MEPEFKAVLTVTGYFDGPRKGIANLLGQPHLFESQWKDINTEDEDVFLLTSLPPHLVESALEDWNIWVR